ncbi:hypothetical protein C8Q70DRAFT_246336 [Cubamyces menziesii]|nr:hypothetical protein C8Q70DRAFT_246336 [Cubamyces menziesii]
MNSGDLYKVLVRCIRSLLLYSVRTERDRAYKLCLGSTQANPSFSSASVTEAAEKEG